MDYELLKFILEDSEKQILFMISIIFNQINYRIFLFYLKLVVNVLI